MSNRNGSTKAKKYPSKPLSGTTLLKADNYTSNEITVSVHVVSEPVEVIKLKELAIAQTVRAVYERSLLLKMMGKQQ